MDHSNPLNDFAVFVFGDPMAAIWIAAVMLICCAWVVVSNWLRHYSPLQGALQSRLDSLAFVVDTPTVDDAQAEFAARLSAVNETMLAGGKEAAELRHAWTQFRETILDETVVPLGATTRPEGYFLHLGDDTRVLAWWANIFVAVGLTFTFLGIVAALTSTVTALQTTASGNMTPALINLLTITSVKFWTSIAGVVASIILRWFDRKWHDRTQQKLEMICDRIERGTLFSPDQRIAAEQLRETREQTATLKTFSHELAVAIGDNLERQMAPMISVLGGIQTSIEDFKSGSFNQIGKELGEALSRQAGTEMAQLGAALGDMATKLSTIHEQIEGSGRAANDQIAAAARDFSTASERMNEMFASLNDRISDTGSRMTTAADDASKRALEQFAHTSEAVGENFNKLREEMSEYSARLASGAEEAATRNSKVLSEAADVLSNAAARASTGMNEALDAAIAKASEKSAEALTSAFAGFGDRFASASSNLVDTVRTTADRMEALAASIERSTIASGEHATRLHDAGAKAQAIAITLTQAADGLQGAATPVQKATEAISSALGSANDASQRQAEAAEANRLAVATVSERLGETTEAATRAWSEYRGRFEEVDRALAAALDQVRSASAEHANHLNEQVGKIDLAFANAVDTFSATLEPLKDLADQMEDLIGRLPQPE